MENQLQRVSSQVQQWKDCSVNLKNALIKKDKQAINNHLAMFKNGAHINFSAVLSVNERLPQMYKQDPDNVIICLTAALFMAFESMNLARPMNEGQIIDLVDTILDSSSEDYLSLEDIVLFLQGLVRGKYGALYESMDIPKFMDKFEIYRQERHEALINHRYEQSSRFKDSRINTEIISDDKNREALKDYLRTKK
ncbi:MAG TPA: hypothetical protein VFV31_10565, partial [Chitinophagaceae bacterium]|nr:hypothetical protein [Chitinophagaceae bacterium]